MGLIFGLGGSRKARDFTAESQLSRPSPISNEDEAGVFLSFLASCWARNMLTKSRAEERFSIVLLVDGKSSWSTFPVRFWVGETTEILDNMREGTFENELCMELSTLLKEFDESRPTDFGSNCYFLKLGFNCMSTFEELNLLLIICLGCLIFSMATLVMSF